LVNDDFFDFGFTAVDETELKAVQDAAREAEVIANTANDAQLKLDALFNAVQPLLNNLKANPEKEYILWPNRVEKVEAFESKLLEIYTK
tara:strand:+ start:1125 stop:1391 length:267 start_codon:yes stop_codon:yes gene_type:complete